MSDSSSPTSARHLVLIGYRGSGKSTIGKLVARLLGLDYLDTDTQIQEKAGKSIREIFAEQGEEDAEWWGDFLFFAEAFWGYQEQLLKSESDGFLIILC